MWQSEDSYRSSLPSYGSVGAFDIDESGRLSPHAPAAKLGMRFSWRGRPVSTALRTTDDGSVGVMLLRAQAGRVPSTAIAAAARPDAFDLLRCLPTLLPEHWTVSLAADHSLQLQTEMRVAMPASASDLLIPAVQFCLAVSPYLDLLEENAMGMQA